MSNELTANASETNMQVIEINGVKMQIDMRQATVVENYKVGDNIKVLIKDYSSYKSYPAVIIGFDQFNNLPTIVIMYIDSSYSKAELKTVFFNAQSENIEIAQMSDIEKLGKSDVVAALNRDIEKKTVELHEMEAKKAYFLKYFNKHFLHTTTVSDDIEEGSE